MLKMPIFFVFYNSYHYAHCCVPTSCNEGKVLCASDICLQRESLAQHWDCNGKCQSTSEPCNGKCNGEDKMCGNKICLSNSDYQQQYWECDQVCQYQSVPCHGQCPVDKALSGDECRNI